MIRIAGLSVVLVLALDAVALPDEKSPAFPSAVAARPEATAEAMTAWQWFHEVTTPGGKSPYVDFLLTNEVFGEARTDLADLRLRDDHGGEVPYALRVRRTRQEQHPLEARQFNRAKRADRSLEVSLDLGRQDVEHNLIEINTQGDDFRRRVRIEGSDNGDDWRLLSQDWLVRFPVRGHSPIESNRVTYPPSRYRYLRVQVHPDLSQPDDSPDITSVSVFHAVDIPGEYRTLPAVLGPREPDKTPSGPGSAWRIDLGADSVPCEMLSLAIGDESFARHYDLESVEPGGVSRIIAEGELRRLPGSKREAIEIHFAEITAHLLKLRVTDYRNPPLDLKSVQYTAPAREVVFARGPNLAWPLRLYVGNPRAEEPHYDFAASLAETVSPRRTAPRSDRRPPTPPTGRSRNPGPNVGPG